MSEERISAFGDQAENDYTGFEPADVTNVLGEVMAERWRQHEKWGEQNHPNGTGPTWTTLNRREEARQRCERAAERGEVTYRHILDEEFREALAEADPAALRAELIQVAAVAVAWVEKLDRIDLRVPPATTDGGAAE